MEILETLLLLSYIATALLMLFFYVVHKFSIDWAGEVEIETDIPMPVIIVITWVFSPITIFIFLYHIKIKMVK